MTSTTCAVSSVQLKIEDLSTVQNALTPVAHIFLVFGSNISVPHHILAEVGKTNCDFDEKLYKVLEYRLKQLPLLTWHDIVRALRSPAVHEQVLASEIESQYIPCSSSQPQLVSDQSSTEHLDIETKSQQEDRTIRRKRRHSPPHEKSCKHRRKARKPKRACKKYAKQPRLFQPHSKPLANMSSNAKRLCPSPWSEGLLGDFIKYLKSRYRSCPVEKRTNVLKLPNPGNVFINLAFIDRKTEGLRTEYDEITEAMVRDGNVDVIEGRKCPIDINKIAANLPATTLETLILVEGAPGVGKSTFAWEFCRRWERGEIAQQYDLVLLLRLRHDRISKAKCWKDLIYHSSPSVLQAVISELEARSGFGVLFILEGYDELPDECRHPSSPLLKLISGEELHLATLMITSRPWATCDVLKRFKNRIFQHIEVLGFTKSQISSYIQSVLSEEEVEDLEKKLLKHGEIMKCMYIPLNCAIVVTVYQESKASGDDMPSTMSELYLALLRTILLRYLRGNDPFSDPIECFDELPDHVLEKFKYLCGLAYSGVAEAGDQIKLIFSDLPPDFDGLGFMDSVFQLYVTRKIVASHNFLHLTFQEFLAAVHISNMEAQQQLQHFKRHEEGRLKVVLRFLAGITKLKDFSTPSSFASLLDQPMKCGYTAIDYTIRPYVCTWVYEALGKEVIKRAFHEDVTVECADNDLSDSAALGYCIAHSCCKWVLSVSGRMKGKEIDILVDESQISDSTGGVIVGLRGELDEMTGTFQGLSVSLTELNSIFTGLHIRLSELALKLPAKCSQISWPELSSLQSLTIDIMHEDAETINWELNYLLPQLSLSSLTLLFHPSLLSFEDSKAVANYITNTSTLKYLHILVYCPKTGMDEIFAAVIEKEVRPNFTLQIYNSDCEICNEDAENLGYYIRTTALSKLFFPNLIFSVFGALQVARALRAVHDLKADKLYFSVIEQCDVPHAFELINDYSDLLDKQWHKELAYNVCVSFLLPDSTTSEWRFNVEVDIDDVVVEHLAEAVRNYSSVQALRLHGECVFSDVGTKALAEAVNCNPIVEELEVSQNKAGSVNIVALVKAIGSNTALKKLVLHGNDISDVGAKVVAEVLNCNTILDELDLSHTKICSVGTEALAEAIVSNTVLRKLAFSCNGIGDAGAKAFSEVLNCNTILEELDISSNKIGSVGAEALAKAIGSNTSLKKLNLSENHICFIGAKALAEVLNCNTILEELYISGTNIGSVGAEALAEAIGSNTALKKLDLSYNFVGDVGAKALSEVLNCNTILEELDLSLNNIGDVGAKALAEGLNCNTTLGKLDLSANEIGYVGVEALAQAIGSNTTLKKLSISGNDVGDAGAKALAEGLNCNTILEELYLSDRR